VIWPRPARSPESGVQSPEPALWFWNPKVGGAFGAYYRGCWNLEDGRPALHRVIWERMHGRPLRPDELVVCADGNKNNLAPGNLETITRAQNAIRNKEAGRARQGELRARLLLEHFNAGGSTSARLKNPTPRRKARGETQRREAGLDGRSPRVSALSASLR